MNKKIPLRSVILLSSTSNQTILAIIMPIMGIFTLHFPDAGIMVNMLISLPALLMLPAILLSGKLSQYISKKTLLLIGTAVFAVGGIGCTLYDNIYFLVFMRGMMGIGCGIIYPLPPALIAQLYEKQEIPKMMGWVNAAGCIIAAILAMLAGYLALKNWHYAFYLYSLYALLLIAQAVVLPKVPPEKLDSLLTKSNKKVRLNWSVYFLSVGAMIFMMFQMVTTFKLAIFLQQENIGNTSTVGILQAVQTFASFTMGVFFAQIFSVLKRNTCLLSLIMVMTGFFLLSFAHSFISILVSLLFSGLSMGLMIPFFMTRIAAVSPKGTQTMALSLLTGAFCLGQFLVAYYLRIVELFTSGDIRSTFLVVAISYLISTVITIVFLYLTKRNRESSQ